MVTWLIQSQGDIAAPPWVWLSAAEQAEYGALRVTKRRQDWLAGRWTAKRLIQAARADAGALELDTIQTGPARGRAPQACWPGSLGQWPLSISHCDGRAVALLADDRCARLGIDLEYVEARAPNFADDYFTHAEQEGLGHQLEAQAERVTAIWCAKEAALKALGVGLTVDTRAVNVWLDWSNAPCHGWRRLQVDVIGSGLRQGLADAGEALHGWWRCSGRYVLAVVTGTAHSGAAGWPVEIQPAASQARVA